MSWEGYGQVFCSNGHFHGNWDPYADNSGTEATHALCPACKAPPALVNVVDDTNCDSYGILTNEAVQTLLVSDQVVKTCDLGHSHVVSEAVYRIPSQEEIDSLRSYWDEGKKIYIRIPPRDSRKRTA